MKVDMLYPAVIAIILIGMIAGVGVLLLDKTAISVKDSTAIVNETIVITAGVGATTNDDLLTLTYFGNDTVNTVAGSASIVITDEVNWTTAGVITVSTDNFTAGSYEISYTYDKDSAATTALVAGRDATADIPEDWLGLIVLIMVMAIILTLVISSFAKGRR